MNPARSLSRPSFLRALAVLVLALTGTSATRADVLDRLFPHDIDVVTVTDVTPEGRNVEPGSPAKPVYYEALNVGYTDWGLAVKGDVLPPEKAMLDTIVKTLAANGYRPANRSHKPSLLLVFAWGTLRPSGGAMGGPGAAMKFLGADKMDLMWDAAQKFPWVDSRVLLRGFRSSEALKILAASQEPLYAAVVRAYDFQAVNAGRAVLLWETRMGCPAPGLQCDQALPQMIKVAGPVFGRDTPKPVWVNASDRYRATVELGEAKVLDYVDASSARIIDLKTLSQTAKSKPAPVKP